MRKISSWGLAQCLLWACVSGLGNSTDCSPIFLTKTVFVSTTIYTSLPTNVTTVPTSSGAPWVNTTTTSTSNIGTTTSIPLSNTTSTTRSSIGTSAPFSNTTTTTSSSTSLTTSIPSVNTTISTSSSITTSSAPFSNTTTSTSSTIGTSPPFSNTTTTASSSITTSAPFSNTTTTISSSVELTTTPPFGNTTTRATTAPTTLPSSTTSETTPPSTTSSTTVSSSTISPTTVPSSTIPSSTASSSTSAPPKPSDPFGRIPPLPPGPFRGFKNAVYFTNWGVNSGYHPQELPVSELTHIFYAFADFDEDGTVKSSDPAIDLEKRYPMDSTRNNTNNVYGAVKQLFIHKKYNRNLKVLLSIGGWDFSPKFAVASATDASRRKFATSAVKLVTDWGFDGIDIDWEYPSNDVEKENFVRLLQECRREFDRYSFLHGVRYRFSLSVATPASPQNYEKLDLTNMNKFVDSWHLMAYDYSGGWDTVSGHQANVFSYPTADTTGAKRASTDDAVRYYQSRGVHPQKILMGLPLYGRAFEGTSGLGQNYSSIGDGGPQPGVWYYKDLPKPGAEVVYDDIAKATYSYDAKNRELVSYDDVRSTTYKSRYLKWHRLGGAFFWEASGDKGGIRSLINTMSKNLDWLDETRNNLHYPTSRYRNIRWGMPGE